MCGNVCVCHCLLLCVGVSTHWPLPAATSCCLYCRRDNALAHAATTPCTLALGTLLEMGGVHEVLKADGLRPLVDLAVSESPGYLEALNALELMAVSEVRAASFPVPA